MNTRGNIQRLLPCVNVFISCPNCVWLVLLSTAESKEVPEESKYLEVLQGLFHMLIGGLLQHNIGWLKEVQPGEGAVEEPIYTKSNGTASSVCLLPEALTEILQNLLAASPNRHRGKQCIKQVSDKVTHGKSCLAGWVPPPGSSSRSSGSSSMSSGSSYWSPGFSSRSLL